MSENWNERVPAIVQAIRQHVSAMKENRRLLIPCADEAEARSVRELLAPVELARVDLGFYVGDPAVLHLVDGAGAVQLADDVFGRSP